MRIAIGGISHETNTFCAAKTEFADFERSGMLRGQAIVDTFRGVRSDPGGMIDAAERLGIEVAPTFLTGTEPSGTISHDAYTRLRDELLASIQAVMPVDAVCLSLHGAGVAEGAEDLEGSLITEVRRLVGPDVPILVTLDLHGNITPTMIERADVLLGCHLYPHTDMYERGVEAVELAQKIVQGTFRPVMHLTKLPMIVPASTTFLSPARDINELCWEWEAGPGVVDVAFFHGFPYTDVPDVAVTVVAVADGDADLARRASEDIARQLWERRDQFRASLPNVREAIRQALDTDGGPVVIAETSDNAGGGAAGDGTHLLRAMLEADLTDACFATIYDPETVQQAIASGAGSTIDARIGGKTDELHGRPIETPAYVKLITDGKGTIHSPGWRGMTFDLGKCARLVVDGIDVIVASVRTQTIDPEWFLLHGIDISRYKIVALKSSQHFRAGFDPVSARIIRTDSPGATSEDMSLFNYQRIPRPIWPFDEGVEFSVPSAQQPSG
jgi:microcystin degradation protein MlrC